MGSGVNLIPAPILTRRRERRMARRGLAATAIYLTLLFAATTGYLSLNTPPRADAAAGELAVSADRIALRRQQIGQIKRQLVEADRQIAGARVLSERPDWSTMLRLVATAAGPEVLLHDFSLGTTGATIDAGAWVALRGFASDPGTVSAFALRLEALGLFDRVTIESSRREPFGGRTATSFNLRCELHGADRKQEAR